MIPSLSKREHPVSRRETSTLIISAHGGWAATALGAAAFLALGALGAAAALVVLVVEVDARAIVSGEGMGEGKKGALRGLVGRKGMMAAK